MSENACVGRIVENVGTVLVCSVFKKTNNITNYYSYDYYTLKNNFY